MKNRKYLFVCGCPRSGTSALVKLLNTHPSIALGIERYKRYAKIDKIHGLTPGKFKSKSFFNIKPKQTNINPSHKSWDLEWKEIYENLKIKFNRKNTIVGDKYPYYYRFYHEIDRAFNCPKWIFILRNIHEVASSYNVRASNPHDRWKTTHNYIYAVKDWNESLTQTWQYLESGSKNLLICEYEKLFYGNTQCLYQLLNFLNIRTNLVVEKYHQDMTRNWQYRLLKSQNLDFQQVKYIDANANWSLRDRLLKKYGRSCTLF